MAFETIIAVDALRALQGNGADPLVLDCEFDLGDPAKGHAVFLSGHVPGARYLHLDEDLSGVATGRNGRHPLPDREVFAACMRELGLRAGRQLVCYDGSGNAYAARCWWLLRWIGHREVAVLDGGRQAWIDAGLALESGEAAASDSGDFTVAPSLVAEPVTVAEVMANIASGEQRVLDARDPGRFRGDASPLDPVSGHIPGARNRFFRDNLDATGRFLAPDELARAFAGVLGDTPPAKAIMQCGSGVTACHNALALEIAGMPGARLYPGSWSEWIADPARPVETGEG